MTKFELILDSAIGATVGAGLVQLFWKILIDGLARPIQQQLNPVIDEATKLVMKSEVWAYLDHRMMTRGDDLQKAAKKTVASFGQVSEQVKTVALGLLLDNFDPLKQEARRGETRD